MLARLDAAVRPIAHSQDLANEEAPNLASIFRDKPLERLGAGSALFWEGDPARHVFEVVEGVLRIFRVMGDGRRAITGFLYPGDLVGVSMRDRYLYNAEAVTTVRFRRHSSTAFQGAICHSPELRPLLFARLCDEMAAAQDQMVLLSRKNAEERICSFLLTLARRLSGDGSPATHIELAMTRLDMADYLGLTIETVSRTMTALAGRGVVRQAGRHGVSLMRLDIIQRLAGDAQSTEEPERPSNVTRRAVWPS